LNFLDILVYNNRIFKANNITGIILLTDSRLNKVSARESKPACGRSAFKEITQ